MLEGIGTMIGAGAGLGLGVYDRWQDAKRRKAAQEAISKATGDYGATMSDLINEQQATNASNAQPVLELLGSADWDSAGKVDFNKDNYNIDDYYDTRRAQLVGSAGRSAQGSAALSGMGRSLGTAQGIAAAQADRDASLYKDALAQRNSEMNFDYGMAKDSAAQRLQALRDKISSAQGVYNIQKGLNDDFYGSRSDLIGQMFNAGVQSMSIM